MGGASEQSSGGEGAVLGGPLQPGSVEGRVRMLDAAGQTH